MPARGGEPVCLYFVDAVASTEWEIFAVDRQRVAKLSFGSEYAQCWPTRGVAAGVYRAVVQVRYANAVTETKTCKIMVLP